MIKQKNDRFSQPDQSISDEDHFTGTRRRGELLDKAILQAAWDELNEVGYAHLTMEGVASRAKTNKSAVYRRWPNRSKLVVAVLHKHVPKPADDVPNTGDLRSDVLILLRRITQPLQSIGAETMHGLMIEYLGKEFISSFPHLKHSEFEKKWKTTMLKILKNAEMRGEVNLERISPRVISSPLDLLRYEFLTTYEPVSDETLTEIIDQIYLPLVLTQPIIYK